MSSGPGDVQARCDCMREHYRSADGRCTNPPLWTEDPELDRRYGECGCCMADCPDVHEEPDPEFRFVPGSLVIAQEYVDTVDEDAQRGLRAQAERGELRIAPRSRMHR